MTNATANIAIKINFQIEGKEEWKDIEGYENSYEVSTKSNIRNKRNGRILKHFYNSQGYAQVELSQGNEQKQVLVHRIVALAFLENDNPEEKKVVCHIDGNPSNPDINNLMWDTQSNNLKDPRRTERLLQSEGFKNHLKRISKPVFLTSLKTADSYFCNSISSACKLLNVSANQIRKAHENNTSLKNFIIKIEE